VRCPQQAAVRRSEGEVGTGVGHTWCPSTLPSSAHPVRAGEGGRSPGAPCLAHPGGGDRWWGYVFLPCILWALCHMTPIGLAASWGAGTLRLQRPSIRAGSHTRHLILHASCDESWKACGRRPHLSDGFLHGPGSLTGRLHQDQGREVTQHLNSAYASLRAAPSGITPVSRKRQSAMSNLRATATIPMRRKRLPPPPKRSRNQQLSALSGW
jgi:hypothetical protein